MNSLNTVNKQILVGQLDADAEGRAMASGDLVTNLKVVTYDQYRERGGNGETKDIPEYHRVAVYGAAAEGVRNLKKGAIVYIEGRSKTRKYKEQPSGLDRYITEIIVSGFNGKCVAMGEIAISEHRTPSTPARQADQPATAQATPGAPASAWDETGDDRPY